MLSIECGCCVVIAIALLRLLILIVANYCYCYALWVLILSLNGLLACYYKVCISIHIYSPPYVECSFRTKGEDKLIPVAYCSRGMLDDVHPERGSYRKFYCLILLPFRCLMLRILLTSVAMLLHNALCVVLVYSLMILLHQISHHLQKKQLLTTRQMRRNCGVKRKEQVCSVHVCMHVLNVFMCTCV